MLFWFVFSKLDFDFAAFLRLFIGQALLLAANLNIQIVKYITKEQGFFKKILVAPDNTTSQKLLKGIKGPKWKHMHIDDANHVSSAWSYMNRTRTKTVFVSLDFRTILYYADQILNLIDVHCVDPLYAAHFI